MTTPARKKPRVHPERKESHVSSLLKFIKLMVLGLSQFLSGLWTLNPLKAISRRQKRLYVMESYDRMMIKPKFRDRVLDLFLTDYRRRQRILHWVHTKLRSTEVHDFSTCWQDGTVLCALLESICPGVCPSFHLLSPLNMVKNCRLGIKLANKYLYVPMVGSSHIKIKDLLTPEEMAIANQESEFRIIQYVSMIKWASENIKEKWSSLHESLIAAKTGRCFAKGSGLRNGIVGKRSKFTVVVSDTIGVFNLLVEVRGPNNEYSGERIVSLHQAKGVMETPLDTSKPLDTLKYLEDCVGNTFIRKKIPGRFASDSQTDVLCLDFQCGEEGTFYVTFVPRRAGIHAVAVKWQNHHVESSPFRIKVYKASNVSSISLKGAREKRVIYDSLSLTPIPGHSNDSFDVEQLKEHTTGTQEHEPGGTLINALTKAKAYSKGRQLTVIGRKVLRRVITRNGGDIVIEEAISPSLSRQSSITDNSDDDNRYQKHKEDNGRVKMLTSPGDSSSPINITNKTNPLGTVLEEKQNSRENLFENIDLSEIVLSDSFRQKLEEYNMKAINVQNDTTKHQKKKSGHEVDIPDVSMKTSHEVQLSKYTCTDINEHNLLDMHDDQRTGSFDQTNPDSNPQGVIMSSWFREGPLNGNICANKSPLKRSPLQRTTSIYNGNKTSARRTVSDGKIYTLRRSIVSFAASDMSETSSEVSSDDRQSGTEDDSGVTGPALKLLHSHSLRKACMYISGNPFSNTQPNDDRNQRIDNDIGLVRTKLRASRSLPTSAKPVPNDGGNEISIQVSGLPETLSKESDTNDKQHSIKRNNSQPSQKTSNFTNISIEKSTRYRNEYDCRKLLDDITGTFINIYITDGHKTHTPDYIDAEKATEKDASKYSIDSNEKTLVLGLDKEDENQGNVVSRYQHDVKENGVNGTSVSTVKEEDGVVWHHKTAFHKDIVPPTHRDRLSRGTLTRQWKVCCQKSLQDVTDPDPMLESSSLSMSDENFKQRCTEISTLPMKAPFKSIFIQSSDDAGDKFTREVLIVVPKPKIDKQTQVCDSEITRETGWDFLQGFYLLLRRISIKLPDFDTALSNSVDGSLRDLNKTLHNKEGFDLKTPSKPGSSHAQDLYPEHFKLNYATTQCLQVPFDNNPESIHVGVSDSSSCPQLSPRSGSLEESKILGRKSSDNGNNSASDDGDNHVTSLGFTNGDNIIVKELSRPSQFSYHTAVDEWFRRNDSMLKVPQRQQTVETVDSGFDDNLTHFTQHARNSLPSLRTVSGHVRLYRRNYRGKIPLDPKLVTSNSSQSLSFDKRDLGNEADDELLVNSSTEQKHTRSQRRRHKRQTRENSVSFSDSEINQRRHYLRKRNVGARRQCMIEKKASDRIKESVGTSASENTNHAETHDFSLSEQRNKLQEKFVLHRESSKKDKDDRINNTEDKIKLLDKDSRKLSSSVETSDINISRKIMTNNRSTTASSLESNYCGFGVTKPNRHALLSHLGDFQNLYTTEEKPDEETRTNTDKDLVSENGRSRDQTSQQSGISDTCNLNEDFVKYDKHINEQLKRDDTMSKSVSLDNKSQEEDIINGSESSYLTAKFDNDFEVPATSTLANSDFQQEGHSLTEFFAQQLDNDVFFDNNVYVDDISTSEDDMTFHVAGAGLYHGLVGVSNSFQVWTDRSLFDGSLSVNIAGPRSHTVTETSVLYTGDNLYEVSYGVTHPGFYRIYVKWGEEDLPNSPFICQITL